MRGFSDEERAEIEAALVATGKELFVRHGFQKTTVREVTDAVGIAEGTFYRFFDAKADLYTRVLIDEHEALFDTVAAALEDVDDPAARVERLVAVWAREFEQRPLLKTSHQAPVSLLRKLDHDAIEAAKARFVDRIAPVLADLRAETDGVLADLEPPEVLEVLSVVEQAVAQGDVHDEYGWTDYETFRDTLVTILARGMVAPPPGRSC